MTLIKVCCSLSPPPLLPSYVPPTPSTLLRGLYDTELIYLLMYIPFPYNRASTFFN